MMDVRTALMVGWEIFCIIVTVKIILDAILIKRETKREIELIKVSMPGDSRLITVR